ncbi:MAG: periplasmic flagellar collar protein FlcA, partial [Spirochaetaceae bacterium]
EEVPAEAGSEIGTPEAGEELEIEDVDLDEALSALGLEDAEESAGAGPEEETGEAEEFVSGEELAGLTEEAPEAPGTEEAEPEPEEPEEAPGTEEAEPEEPEELSEEDLAAGGFEEPEEFDLSDFAEDFDFSPEEAEIPDLDEAELEAGPEEGPPAEPMAPEEPAALEEPPAAEAPEEPPEEPPAAEPPEEIEEFSFDVGEEEPEAPPVDEAAGEEAGGPPSDEEFTFEDETFEVPGEEEFEEPTAEAAGARGAAPGVEELDEEELDEFSLGDLGAEFGGLEEEVEGEEPAAGDAEAELNPAVDVSGAEPPAPEDAAAADIELTDEEFAALQETLEALPLNLKVAVEEVIAEQYGGAEATAQLVRMLVEGETARHIADYAGRLLGRHIDIPRGYEKRTGRQFERRRDSFAYRLRENILPVVRTVVLTVLLLGAVTFLSYRYVYRPFYARSLYEQGLDQIEADRYPEGNELFDRAVEVWPLRSRYYEYAEAFQDKRRFDLARDKYEGALRRYHGDKGGMLGYAEMESELTNYETAENLVRVYLEGTGVPTAADDQDSDWGYRENREFMSEVMDLPTHRVPRIEADPFDLDALLLRGDNFMRWARNEDEQYFENARRAYTRALEHHGREPEIMFRFLDYFMARDNREEVENLVQEFEADPELEIDTEIYARLGGYLLDAGMMDYVTQVLERTIARAREENTVAPEAHYHLARYYRETDEPVSEKRALDNAVRQFEYLAEQGPLDRRAEGHYIDTHGRLGEYYFRQEEHLTAEDHFSQAVDRYRRAAERGVIEPERRFGRVHASYADLLYYVSRDYDDALDLYETARENDYYPPEVAYKQGFIHYRNSDYEDALDRFLDAAGDYSENRSILFATANALYHRDSLGAAEGYYRELLEMLESERARIDTFLPEEDPEHEGLVEYLIKVRNNLGVTMQRLAERGPEVTEASEQGLGYLTQASETAVNVSRNPETAERGESVSLPYLNMRRILYPQSGYDLEIYSRIPEDLEDVSF